VVVVAGGFNGRLMTSIEVVHANDLHSGFTPGPELPRPISLSQMVRYRVTRLGDFSSTV
jgi:hypothetical protein